MADIITFDGEPVMEEGAGIITNFSRGVCQIEKIFEPVARGDGEFVKHLQKRGCDHAVEFMFINVDPGNVGAIEDTVLSLAEYKTIGTLAVPSKGLNVTNCVVSEVNYIANEFALVITEGTGGAISYEEKRLLTFEIIFRQLI